MEFRILGDRFEIHADAGVPIRPPDQQVRQLLCVLAAEEGRTIPAAELTDLLWDQSDDKVLSGALKRAVHDARQILPPDSLVRELGGYRLRIDSGDGSDLATFRNLTGEARAAREDEPRDAAAAYRRALDLWGEPPLGDLPETAAAEPVRRKLFAERHDAQTEFAETLRSLEQRREPPAPPAEERAPSHGIDITLASPARIYDFFLGGKDNYEADRAVAEQLTRLDPEVGEAVRENRRFLSAAVRHLVEETGIRQFLDIGTGLPTQDNVHQVAHRYAPETRVVYVDHDPVVLTHARALLDGDHATIVEADLRRPDELLAHPGVRDMIDFTEPVAVLMVAVLHFITDDDDPYGLVAPFREAMAPGSRLVVSHGTADGPGGNPEESEDAYESASSRLALRSRAQVAPFFDGLEMVPPGLTWVQRWWPERPLRSSSLRGLYAGIGVKPAPGGAPTR